MGPRILCVFMVFLSLLVVLAAKIIPWGYREGDVAVLKPERLQYGFLAVDAFAGWEVGGRVVKDAELRLKVDGPVEVRALWAKDYTQLVALQWPLGWLWAASWR